MKTLIIGEALLDMARENGVLRTAPGGSPANVALGLGRLGLAPVLHTALGDDEAGRTIRAHIEASGARLSPGSVGARSTSTATADISADGDAVYDFAIEWDPAPLPVDGYSVVHTGSLGSWLAPGAAVVGRMLDDARAAGGAITFDPNIRVSLIDDEDRARRLILRRIAVSDLVKMSDEDAAWLFPGAAENEVLDTVLDAGARVAAVTRGSRGAVIATRDHRIFQPSKPVAVADTIGAGDTFMTVLVAAVAADPSLLEGPDGTALEQVLDRALTAASITVSRSGADLPWASELS
ncbi:carbohydrate kinase [Microbacterium oryzae]|nr:PfkB family carbohydrate kinase [Microbacterium oryzae]